MITPEIVGIGVTTLDQFYAVDEFPNCDGVWEVGDTAMMGGGPVATAIATAAALGSQTMMIDRLAGGWQADYVIQEYRDLGVNTSAILQDTTASPAHAAIMVRKADGKRAIAYKRQTAAELLDSEINMDCIKQAKYLHLNGRHDSASVAAAKAVRANGGHVSFDGGAGRFRAGLEPFLELSDILVVASAFATELTGITSPTDSAIALHQLAPRFLTGVTDGENGSWIHDANGNGTHIPVVPSPHIIDTTGCGDVYHGTLLHFLNQGADPVYAATQASRVASINTRGLGGRYALTSPELAEFTQSR